MRLQVATQKRLTWVKVIAPVALSIGLVAGGGVSSAFASTQIDPEFPVWQPSMSKYKKPLCAHHKRVSIKTARVYKHRPGSAKFVRNGWGDHVGFGSSNYVSSRTATVKLSGKNLNCLVAKGSDGHYKMRDASIIYYVSPTRLVYKTKQLPELVSNSKRKSQRIKPGAKYRGFLESTVLWGTKGNIKHHPYYWTFKVKILK